MSDAQRKRAGLWTRREWASVKPELRGTTRETTKLWVKKTFGNSMLPEARTHTDVRCYRIASVKGDAKFSLKLCVDGKLIEDLV